LKFVRKTAYPVKPGAVREISRCAGLSEYAAELLCLRGIEDAEQARRFLNPDASQLYDPLLLPDMEKSVRRIRRAVESREKIMIFCDYDADGTCGGSALYLHLKSAGADVGLTTPNRHKEGYGLSLEAVEDIAASGVKLIITVDCGITNVAETALARSLGMDVIITDHHECALSLPDTPYIINAKRPDSSYPFPHLPGCGVAFKLIQALSSLSEALKYIDLIAVGTVTDIVPLLSENRVISALGIKKLKEAPSAGIAALAQAAGISLAKINSFGLSFGLGPRINAAGRMDSASLALEILSARAPSEKLRENANRLCALNERRKIEVDAIIKEASEEVRRREYMKDAAILVADSKWNPGIAGIAAAKIAEKYTRPCIIFGGGDGSLIGSARSVEGINIYEALARFSDRFEKFGGHAQAAGLTIAPEALGGLREDLCAYIKENYGESVFEPVKRYDIEMKTKDITRAFVEEISRFEPFGAGNERPCIALFGAEILNAKYFGNGSGPHLKFALSQGGSSVDAVSFFFRDSHSLVSRSCDALCEAETDDYTRNPRLIAREINMKYDSELYESFAAANAEKMAGNFINEFLRVSNSFGRIGEEEFSRRVSEELSRSRFGFCICAKTAPALRRVLGNPVVLEALESGALSLFDEKSYSAANCVACAKPPGFERVLRAGACGEAFFDDALSREYIEYSKRFFLNREELLRVYAALSAPLSREELMLKASLSHEKAAFALAVFGELKLIEEVKSGRILAIKNGERKDLRDSAVFRAFENP